MRESQPLPNCEGNIPGQELLPRKSKVLLSLTGGGKLVRRFALLTVLVLAGCVSPAPYQPLAFGGGYSDHMVDTNHYQVLFNGNAKTAKDRVDRFWLYRCAEVTQQHGFAYFAITPALDKHPAPNLPANSATMTMGIFDGQQVHMSDGVYRPVDGASARPVAHGGGTVPIYIPGGQTITIWNADAVVGMFNDPDPAGGRCGVERTNRAGRVS
jgi:hypothetical protein